MTAWKAAGYGIGVLSLWVTIILVIDYIGFLKDICK